MYKATGHAREKPHLPICACEIGDLGTNFKKKLSFLLYLMRLGLRNNEFTYHGLISPRNLTWFTRPFLTRSCTRAGHKTSQLSIAFLRV